MTVLLRFNNVTKRYSGNGDALTNVSFSLARGELAFLTGPSGSGKSTLLRLVPAIERPTRGAVTFDGDEVSKLRYGAIPLLRRKIGIIFQDFRLLNDRTVFDNVALPLALAGYERRHAQHLVHAALDKVRLSRFARRYPPSLSGGEQQRVGIARAIVSKPQLILADEPTGNLDPELSWEVMELFLEFNSVGVSALIASHDRQLVERMHRRVLRLESGRLVDAA